MKRLLKFPDGHTFVTDSASGNLGVAVNGQDSTEEFSVDKLNDIEIKKLRDGSVDKKILAKIDRIKRE